MQKKIEYIMRNRRRGTRVTFHLPELAWDDVSSGLPLFIDGPEQKIIHDWVLIVRLCCGDWFCDNDVCGLGFIVRQNRRESQIGFHSL